LDGLWLIALSAGAHSERGDSILPQVSLCRRQIDGVLGCRQLSRGVSASFSLMCFKTFFHSPGVQHLCMQRDSLQPRKSTTGSYFCDAQDNARSCGDIFEETGVRRELQNKCLSVSLSFVLQVRATG
jgi:hypothetical protein